jgi:phosphoesterase RecJ-like protein
MQALLRALGKDSVIVIARGVPAAAGVPLLLARRLVPPRRPRISTRTTIFLDCGNLDRNPLAAMREAEPLINIDHHHDNTRFGTINHVVEEASCTAEIVWDLIHGPASRSHRRKSPRRSTSGSSPTPVASPTRARRRGRT